jgi:NADPH2:quinone reductase
MSTPVPSVTLEIRSLVRPEGELELSLVEAPLPAPGRDQVLVRMLAAPINPSDLGLLFGAADMASARVGGTIGRPLVTARVPEAGMRAMAARIGLSMPVGNEGAGVVIAGGDSEAARALLGATVALVGGGMYTQFRCIDAQSCLPLPAGLPAVQGCAAFVNPLTALGMVDTMRREGHKALVHTAAASNLGQILQRLCIEEGVELVNIVRTPEQVALLQAQGARHVVNSAAPEFAAELTEALAQTGATIAFDAIGGGRLVSRILSCMEGVAGRGAKEYSRYGSSVRKQVYIYGSLDPAPTELHRNFGFTWSVGGWLLFPYLQSIGPAAVRDLYRRVAAGLTGTFASHFSQELSLAGALRPEAMAAYGRRATGAKAYVNPSLDEAAAPAKAPS